MPALSSTLRPSKRLADTEVQTETPRLRGAVHQQLRRGIQLIAEVEAERTDRCLISQAGTDRVAEIAGLDAERIRPDIAGVQEQHDAELAA